jgi:hypothetical protein
VISFNATHSDESDKDDLEEGINYLAFVASCKSSHESSEYATPDLHESSEGESEEDDLQAAYNNLFVEFTKLKKLNKKTFKKLNEIELEKENLLVTLDDSRALNCKLELDIAELNEKNKSLENALTESKDQLNKFSSDKLNKMLSCQKNHGDKSGLGFVDNCSSMPSTSCVKNVCEKKVMFVPASSDKGKKVLVDPYVSRSKSRIVHPHRKHHSQRFVPTCHHCGKVGHTHPIVLS